VPAPENTVRYEIPNGCNECHRDRDAAWAARKMDGWWPGASRQRVVRRADSNPSVKGWFRQVDRNRENGPRPSIRKRRGAPFSG
jgi:hypothetical protein